VKKFNLTRLLVFLLSVFTLSKFFEAGRLIAEEQTLIHLITSLFSLVVFVLTLFVMGYWVYAEEKEKNNLKHKFSLYEWIYQFRGQKQ
jgi:ammonia channel protein AmtB